jgi:FixJ family two-component response regulator
MDRNWSATIQGWAIIGSQFLPTNDLFIIDDDAATRDALSVVFTLAGYRVTVLAEGDAFIAAAHASVPATVRVQGT